MRRLAPLVVLLALTACGQSADALERVTAAPAATIDAGTARVTTVVGLGGLVGIVAQHLEARGTVDFARGRSSIVVRVGGVRVEERSIGSDLYVQAPPDGQWRHMTPADLTATGADPTGNVGPRQALAILRGVTAAQRLGTQAVRGVSTTHYRARVDLRRAVRRADPTDRAVVQALVDAIGRRAATVEVWLDGKGRASRTRIPVALPGGMDATVTVELHDFGRPVHIEAPPADQIRQD